MWKWLKSWIPDETTIHTSSTLRKLRKYLHHSFLWQLEREPVARGVAVGLFIGILPVIPFQTILAIFLCIALRANFPVAFLASWISNPITFLPIIYFIYYVGDKILGKNGVHTVVHDLTLNFTTVAEFWTSFSKWIYQFGKAFFIGLPIVSIGGALIGYVVVIVIWRIVVLFKRRLKKNDNAKH